MNNLISDVRYALRSMMARAAFTLAAVATLALGIGAGTTVFSVVNAVILRTLPYNHSERLVMIWERFGALGLDKIPLSAPEFIDYRDKCQTLDTVAAFDTLDFNFTGSGEPERVGAAEVTGE